MKNKINELRIGSIIQDNSGVFCAVTSIEIDGYITLFDGKKEKEVNIIMCKPIPITEDILFNFGFVKIEHMLQLGSGQNKHYELNGNDKDWLLFFNGKNFAFNENKLSRKHLIHNIYVHQLQNLYFALTGEELKNKTQGLL